MKAEILSIGTELLLGQIVDTNAAYLSKKLAELGISVFYKSTMGDNLKRISETVKTALSRSDLVMTSGGLGPTQDDLTLQGIASALHLPLVLNKAEWKFIQEKFAFINRPCPGNNIKQAKLPKGSEVLPNFRGTAPGIWLQKKIGRKDKVIVALPGPPKEMKPMFEQEVIPRLKAAGAGKEVILSRVIKTASIGESALEEKIKDLLKSTNPTVAPLLSGTEVHLRLTAKTISAEHAEKLIQKTQDTLLERIGPHVYGFDDEPLEKAVGNLLVKKSLTLAAAESCTGGLLSHRITNVPGSSRYFLGGLTTYSNESKIKELSVREETLKKFGAVSGETAKEMAEGARHAFRADIGIGITGIAGPDGVSPEKPVGLVFGSISTKEKTELRHFMLYGEREQIKERAVTAMLEWLRHMLLD